VGTGQIIDGSVASLIFWISLALDLVTVRLRMQRFAAVDALKLPQAWFRSHGWNKLGCRTDREWWRGLWVGTAYALQQWVLLVSLTIQMELRHPWASSLEQGSENKIAFWNTANSITSNTGHWDGNGSQVLAWLSDMAPLHRAAALETFAGYQH
jgi:hypothetical protein